MELLLLHPEVAYRDCSDCQKHEYDHKTGERLKDGKGLPIVRTSASHIPCKEEIIGCAKGSPTSGKELSPKNRKAYAHYKRCVAVGRFPDDAIVERNAAVIRRIEEEIERQREMASAGHLRLLSSAIKR